jgi:hypothetical protein
MSNFLPSDWPAFGAGSAFEARTGQPGDHRAERPSFGEFSPRRGEMPCVDDIHEPATECDMIGWPRIPSPIIRTEIRFVRSRPLARYWSSTLCGCSLRTPPRTPGHMNRAAVATPSTANRPRSLDPVDFTSLNSRGDLWPLSPHTFTDPVPAGAVHPSRHGIDQPSRAATASMRPATTNGRGSISDVMPATVRRAGTSQGKTGGRSGFGMPSLPSGPAEFATYSPGPTSECWSHRRGNASASPVLPLSCIITRRLAFAAKLRERRSFRAC